MYHCLKCGPLNQEVHDGRDGTRCGDVCIPAGECQLETAPAVVNEYTGQCFWAGMNGQMDEWYLPDPLHSPMTEEEIALTVRPLPGQLGLFVPDVPGGGVE